MWPRRQAIVLGLEVGPLGHSATDLRQAGKSLVNDIAYTQFRSFSCPTSNLEEGKSRLDTSQPTFNKYAK